MTLLQFLLVQQLQTLGHKQVLVEQEQLIGKQQLKPLVLPQQMAKVIL